jgi:hypothetical protein
MPSKEKYKIYRTLRLNQLDVKIEAAIKETLRPEDLDEARKRFLGVDLGVLIEDILERQDG